MLINNNNNNNNARIRTHARTRGKLKNKNNFFRCCYKTHFFDYNKLSIINQTNTKLLLSYPTYKIKL